MPTSTLLISQPAPPDFEATTIAHSDFDRVMPGLQTSTFFVEAKSADKLTQEQPLLPNPPTDLELEIRTIRWGITRGGRRL